MGCLLLGFGLTWPLETIAAPSQVASVQRFHFDVPKAPADVALRMLAQQADAQILVPLDRLRGVTANPVRGAWTLNEALDALFAGTGLEADVLGRRAIFVRSLKAKSSEPPERMIERGPEDITLPAVQQLEEVVVTGSLVQKAPSSQLLATFDLGDLEAYGATNAREIVGLINQNNPTDGSTQTATFGGLTNLANLRSLGPENTLVLFDGKRLVRNPLRDNGVDLNTVPSALVKAVDVLADGASSIYGTDAVAGVINFRSQSEFSGLETRLFAAQPQRTGGAIYSAALAGGVGSLNRDGWNLFFGAAHRQRRPILSVDRAFAATDLRPDRGLTSLLAQTFPANFSQTRADGSVIINNGNPYGDCQPPVTLPYRGGCGLNAAASGFLDLQNPERQTSAVGRLSLLTGQRRWSLQVLGATSTISSALTPTVLNNFLVPPESPYFPGRGLTPAVAGLDPTRPVLINSRFTPAGRRVTENETWTQRILGQVEGLILGGRYELWALHSSSLAKLGAREGALRTQALKDGFAGANGAPFLNPFGAQSEAGYAFLEASQVRRTLVQGRGQLTMAGVTYNRALATLAGGELLFASALEAGRESVRYTRDPANNLLTGPVVGGDQNAYGERDRWSATAEVVAPLTSRLVLDGSVRLDAYSDFGRTLNPKVTLAWTPNSELKIRGSVTTGFRAPTLYNIYSPPTLSFIQATTYNDPLLCPGGQVAAGAGGVDIRDCGQQYNQLVGGNRDLGPERSLSSVFGAEWAIPDGRLPLGWARVEVSRWSYRLKDKIGPLPHGAIFGDPQRFNALLIRCSRAEPLFAAESRTCSSNGAGDPIAYVDQIPTNLGRIETSGFDLDLQWRAATRSGQLSFDYRAQYVTRFDYQRLPGEADISRRSRYSDGVPVIGYSHIAAVGWSLGPWAVQVQNQFKGRYRDCNEECGIAASYRNTVDQYSLFNVSVAYEVSRDILMTVQVRNLFDTAPPFTNANGLCSGCDLRYVDVTGRALTLTLKARLGGSAGASHDR